MHTASTTQARRRMPGLWSLVAVPAVLLVLMWTSSSALATLPGNQLNQKPPITADALRYQGAGELCEGTPAGTAVWHFVLTKTTSSSAMLEVTFAGLGTTQYPSDVRTGGALHWYVSTDSPATLTAASTNASGKRLNLSEICDGGPGAPPTVEPTATFDLETGNPPSVQPTSSFDLPSDSP